MIAILLIYALSALAGALNASEDLIKDKWHETIFFDWTKEKHAKYWNWFAYESWTNKYKLGMSSYGRRTWNILGYYMEIPVQITDWWHFSKMISITCYYICIGVAAVFLRDSVWVVSFIVITAGVIRNLAFGLFYNKILLR